MTYELQNAFERSHFPDDWTESDFNALAEFLRHQFAADFVSTFDDPGGYDYYLFVEVDR